MKPTLAGTLRPSIQDTYGTGDMTRALIKTLATKIRQYVGEDREDMIRLTCWDYFPGGTTAEAAAREIEAAVSEQHPELAPKVS